jgi:hypothetical protein
MDKDYIISEIKRTAQIHGGAPLGVDRFFQETGIRKYDWYGKFWTKWGDAIIEAGYRPNDFNQSLPEDFLLSKFVDLLQELNRFPTSGDLRMKARSDDSFPNHSTFSKFGNKASLVEAVKDYCTTKNLDHLLLLCPIPNTEQHIDKELIEDEIFGTVYLYKSQSYYKIGRTNNTKRRDREIKLQLPFQAEIVHTISTDDPVGIEKYWHQRFASKRLNGEWFQLSKVDVVAFKRRKFM